MQNRKELIPKICWILLLKKNYCHPPDFHIIYNKNLVMQVFTIQHSLSTYSSRTGENKQTRRLL